MKYYAMVQILYDDCDHWAHQKCTNENNFQKYHKKELYTKMELWLCSSHPGTLEVEARGSQPKAQPG